MAESLGEQIVVSLVVARVIYALYSVGLFYEAFGFIFLSLAALLVESAAARTKLLHLNPRSGSSTGIYLGALTLPTVLASRLVELLRLTSTRFDARDFGHSRLEVLAAFACSSGLLLFMFCNSLQYQGVNRFIVGRGVECGGGFTVLCSRALMVLVLLTISCIVAFLPIKFVWVTLHGIGCTRFVAYLLKKFPGCASLGESMLITSGLVLYIGNAFAYTICKVPIYMPSFVFDSFICAGSKDNIAAILQATLLGLLCVPILYRTLCCVFPWTLGFLTSRKGTVTEELQNLCNAAAFYTALTLALMVLMEGWLYIVQGFEQHLVPWVILFVLEEPQRLFLCGYWLVLLFTSALPLYIAKSSKAERIMVRKVFHVMVVMMFTPALLLQQDFLKLAYCVALVGFLVIEMIRVWRVPPLGEMTDSFMKLFTDDRDSDVLIISHFSLLLGCALPLWLTATNEDQPLTPFAGVLSLGIGDTMASVIGYNFGSVRLSSGSKKTVEGTAAGIVSMLFAFLALQWFMKTSSFDATQWISSTLAIVCTGLMEAYTMQLDNAFIPLILFALLTL